MWVSRNNWKRLERAICEKFKFSAHSLVEIFHGDLRSWLAERGTKNEIFWHITSPSASQPLISTTLLCHSYKFNTRVARDEKYKQDFRNIDAVQQQHWQFTGWISKTQIQIQELQIQNRQGTTSSGFKVVRRWHFRKCSHGHFVTFVTCLLYYTSLLPHKSSWPVVVQAMLLMMTIWKQGK